MGVNVDQGPEAVEGEYSCPLPLVANLFFSAGTKVTQSAFSVREMAYRKELTLLSSYLSTLPCVAFCGLDCMFKSVHTRPAGYVDGSSENSRVFCIYIVGNSRI